MTKKFIQKLICFFFGHSYYTIPLNNFDRYGNSYFGTYKCQREHRGHTEDWSYDM